MGNNFRTSLGEGRFAQFCFDAQGTESEWRPDT